MNDPLTAPATKAALHPLVAVAAVAIILFSAVGIAALMGWLPGNKQPAAPVATEAVAPPPPVATAAAPAPAPVAAAPEPKPVEAKATAPAVHKAAPKPAPKAKAAPAPAVVAAPAPSVTPPAPPPAPPCTNCGVVDNVREVTQPGEASGLGAVAGGVIGGILGNQVGKGSGNAVATVLGAAGGAYAGHQIEKSQKKATRYEVSVRMNDGTLQTFMQDTVPAWRIGEHVRVENGALVPAN